MRKRLVLCAFVATALLPAGRVAAQTDGTCIDIAERAGLEFGCFITLRHELGKLPRDSSLFWHLHTFATREQAERARGSRSAVVESLGKTWLFTIADSAWKSASGQRVAVIGSLPLLDANSYTAVYMEGVFKPGMASVVHRHAGPEAWYTLSGQMCVESLDESLTQRAGERGVVVAAGRPMILTGTGNETRRSLVLILQDSSKPRSTPALDWTPKGLCK